MPTTFDALNPAMAPGRTLGSSYAPGDGYIDPPRNVLAYTAALVTSGVEVHEGTAFTGLETSGGEVVGRTHQRRVDRDQTASCSPVGRSSPPSAGWRACGSRPAGPATRSS